MLGEKALSYAPYVNGDYSKSSSVVSCLCCFQLVLNQEMGAEGYASSGLGHLRVCDPAVGFASPVSRSGQPCVRKQCAAS
jgi:hypothetical protein